MEGADTAPERNEYATYSPARDRNDRLISGEPESMTLFAVPKNVSRFLSAVFSNAVTASKFFWAALSDARLALYAPELSASDSPGCNSPARFIMALFAASAGPPRPAGESIAKAGIV